MSKGARRPGADRSARGRRRSRRSYEVAAAIGMRDRLCMNGPMLESTLNGHHFGIGDEVSALSATTRVHQGASAIVLNDEFIAEDLGDLTLHRDFAPVVHGRDGRGRKHHHSWAPGL